MSSIFRTPTLILVKRESETLVNNPTTTFIFGGVAQLVEHLLCTQRVVGSTPIISTKIRSVSRSVAQSGSALLLGSKGRRFKSSHSDHFMQCGLLAGCIAPIGRASDSKSLGCRFESYCARHFTEVL